MVNGKKVVVVMPAYNAEKTLEKTYGEIPFDIVDDVILVDDASHDRTPELSRRMGIHTFIHETNLGYGGNQKSCYRAALNLGADIVIMVHPDYQYTPKLVPAMASMSLMANSMLSSPRAFLAQVPSEAGCRSTNTWPTDF